ncbi:alpha/beta fold hydrolase [Stappia taiwanensis]|uniref:Alpha/beta fold hydrolase n=1 Tax=Stappia taiwanensis TaxID=992267 RepID=A0A838XWU0_9HYPH|nr:alpha/beta fold hydrolase [Stappia taiwanensis]MBA4611373.1 alpha/beta fold hydrolase [Stappia taiwanensis]GGF00812.1 dihydrolipoamide acetyltransferase [Stappia taiwanensis]
MTGDATAGALPETEYGADNSGPPVVFLHGFAADALTWAPVQKSLARSHHTLALDLPGHGRALDWPRIGNAGVSARAVATTLDRHGFDKVHLVGHSMGGTTAALVALARPEQVASLTLLAPGGFGPEINHRLLRRFAAAVEAEELADLLEQFFHPEFRLPRLIARQTAAGRARPGVREALMHIAESLIDGTSQKVLPHEEIAGLPAPVKVIWGTEDRVVPAHQTDGLPARLSTHLFDRIGHMPHLEMARTVCQIIRQQTARG